MASTSEAAPNMERRDATMNQETEQSRQLRHLESGLYTLTLRAIRDEDDEGHPVRSFDTTRKRSI